jgi:hypothetical protein
MVTDWYPDEEGSIVDGFICGFCYADAACNAGEVVTWGTSASGRVAVKPATSAAGTIGDGIGVALKAASGAGSYIPVAFSGIVKMTVDETLAIGDLVLSQSSIALAGIGTSAALCINSATQKILGCVMQASTDESDELLVLLGGDGISAGLVTP